MNYLPSTPLNRKERKERKANPFVRKTQRIFCDVFAYLAVLAVQVRLQSIDCATLRERQWVGARSPESLLASVSDNSEFRIQNSELKSERYRVAEVGDLAIPVELLFQSLGKCLLGVVLTVDQYDFLGFSLTAPEPQQEFAGVGVGGKTRDP